MGKGRSEREAVTKLQFKAPVGLIHFSTVQHMRGWPELIQELVEARHEPIIEVFLAIRHRLANWSLGCEKVPCTKDVVNQVISVTFEKNGGQQKMRFIDSWYPHSPGIVMLVEVLTCLKPSDCVPHELWNSITATQDHHDHAHWGHLRAVISEVPESWSYQLAIIARCEKEEATLILPGNFAQLSDPVIEEGCWGLVGPAWDALHISPPSLSHFESCAQDGKLIETRISTPFQVLPELFRIIGEILCIAHQHNLFHIGPETAVAPRSHRKDPHEPVHAASMRIRNAAMVDSGQKAAGELIIGIEDEELGVFLVHRTCRCNGQCHNEVFLT